MSFVPREKVEQAAIQTAPLVDRSNAPEDRHNSKSAHSRPATRHYLQAFALGKDFRRIFTGSGTTAIPRGIARSTFNAALFRDKEDSASGCYEASACPTTCATVMVAGAPVAVLDVANWLFTAGAAMRH